MARRRKYRGWKNKITVEYEYAWGERHDPELAAALSRPLPKAATQRTRRKRG